MCTKDILDLVFKGLGTIGGLTAAFTAIKQMRLNRKIRARDLRWKQTEAAKKLMDELVSNPKAKDATRMLDWPERNYQIDGKPVTIYIYMKLLQP